MTEASARPRSEGTDGRSTPPRLSLTKDMTGFYYSFGQKQTRGGLYPRADEALPPEAAGRLRTFLDSGESPEG
jgi:hypothetical protein